MTELSSLIRSWITFAGGVLVVAVLYWAQAILVPLAIAVLLTFLFAPAVSWFQRRIGRAAAITVIVLLAFSGLGIAAWGVGRQLSAFAESLPSYRDNIRQKIADVRAAGRGGSVEKVQRTLEEIQNEIDKPAPGTRRGTSDQPVVVASQQVETLWGFPAWLAPFIEPLSTAGLVVVLVIFLLAERQDMRDRLIGVVGYGHLTSTTRALDEAARRVSRYLLMQSLINITYGAAAAVGLYFLGVPYAFLWGLLGAALRFIPYAGPLIAAGAPILVSLAALPGWQGPLLVIGLFVVLELFTNMVLETLLYAGAAGVSQVALLVAVAFWTWLWGPIGLLLATPLTVCLVVLGKHMPGLESLAMLMTDAPALTPEMRYYQRILARDEAEAADILEEHVGGDDPEAVFEALMLPALNYAERDRLAGRLSADEEAAVIDLTRELMEDAEQLLKRSRQPADAVPPAPERQCVTMLGYGANGDPDVLALKMLEVLLGDLPLALEIASSRMLASELVTAVTQQNIRIVCIADLPPSPPSKTRYLVRRLRAAVPDLKIVVGRWGPAEFQDEASNLAIREAGADFVGATLQETRAYLRLAAQQHAVTSAA